jgi:hypothetical protein
MRLMDMLYGMGSFMAAQVVADLKYANPLKNASDWTSFAASGPGSRKGLNAVMGRELTEPWAEDKWRLAHARMIDALQPMIKKKELDLKLDAADWQNCLCEFGKYWKAYTGVGRPKQRFKP